MIIVQFLHLSKMVDRKLVKLYKLKGFDSPIFKLLLQFSILREIN